MDANRSDNRPGQPVVSDTQITNPAKDDEVAKEGYKPKFKLKNIPRNLAGGDEQTGLPNMEDQSPPSISEIQTVSPGDSDVERNISSSREEKTPEQEIQNNNLDLRGSDDEKNVDEKPKPAFKPRFNLKNTRPSKD